jgi:hypothetical protein
LLTERKEFKSDLLARQIELKLAPETKLESGFEGNIEEDSSQGNVSVR